jgi:hypothetical protein
MHQSVDENVYFRQKYPDIEDTLYFPITLYIAISIFSCVILFEKYPPQKEKKDDLIQYA